MQLQPGLKETVRSRGLFILHISCRGCHMEAIHQQGYIIYCKLREGGWGGLSNHGMNAMDSVPGGIGCLPVGDMGGTLQKRVIIITYYF